MPMGKGFAVTSELDLGTMLLDGYYGRKDYSKVNDSAQRLPEIKISAITNDTVATLASLAYSAHAQPSNRVAMGLIVGTGTNSSVIMKLKDLHEQKRASIVLPTGIDHSDAQVVVNTEWTIKGAAPPLHRAGLITRWDRKLDESCEAPGFQPFEYMTAGRYLGELARLILLDYLRRIQQVPGHLLPVCLLERNAIDTMFLSELAACDDAVGVLAKLQSRHPIQEDSSWRWDEQCAILLLKTARALQQRSARMISAAAIGLLVSTGDLRWEDGEQNAGLGEAKSTCEEIIIAFAGGVITSCPEYLSTMQQTIDDLVRKLARADRHQRVILRDANNGGLLGAGVLAGTVWHLP